MKKFTLYSKLVCGVRYKTIKSSDNYEEVYDKGMLLLNKDIRQDRDYFIIEHGVRAINLTNCTVL